MSSFKVHDLIRKLVEFLQRFAPIILELVPEGCLRMYPEECCHHYPVLLEIMYCSQLIVEMLDVSYKHFIRSLLDIG